MRLRTALTRARLVVVTAFLVVTTLLLTAPPAGAQQLIDATEEGGEAFVAFTIMVVIFAFTLFMLDRVRKRRMEEDDQQPD